MLKFGIAGMGAIGKIHADKLLSGKIPEARLAAVCTGHVEKLKEFAAAHPEVETVGSYEEMLAKVDAVLIATPHPMHPPMAEQAFKAGKHVLIEKPAGMEAASVRRMNEAAARSGRVFGIMYNMRMDPVYQKVKELVESGELGNLKRITWTVTDWYRSQAYYDAGTWRATWKGEGGGVLMNQAVHNLDLLQWIAGMPETVWASMRYGAGHRIHVEDDVSAFLEFPGGASGIFVTSTHEAPGTNRLEIAGDMGLLAVEKGEILFYRNRVSERVFNEENREPFAKPENWCCRIPVQKAVDGHAEILKNFTSAVLHGSPLAAPGEEGLQGLILANAMYLSAALQKKVVLQDWDDREYEALLRERMEREMGKLRHE